MAQRFACGDALLEYRPSLHVHGWGKIRERIERQVRPPVTRSFVSTISPLFDMSSGLVDRIDTARCHVDDRQLHRHIAVGASRRSVDW
jgi:hypothetical protein